MENGHLYIYIIQPIDIVIFNSYVKLPVGRPCSENIRKLYISHGSLSLYIFILLNMVIFWPWVSDLFRPSLMRK